MRKDEKALKKLTTGKAATLDGGETVFEVERNRLGWVAGCKV